jgi:hypothetical protein
VSAAIDSQCFTYLISAAERIDGPVGPQADEKVALFRSFLYGPPLTLTETVVGEYGAIRSEQRRKSHSTWSLVNFNRFRSGDSACVIAMRAVHFNAFHSGTNDCRILAEAEAAGMRALVTFDFRFRRRLQQETAVALLTPVEYWESLAVAPGSIPKTIPAPANPLAEQTWWKW